MLWSLMNDDTTDTHTDYFISQFLFNYWPLKPIISYSKIEKFYLSFSTLPDSNPLPDPAFSTTSPNTYLLRCMCELLEVSFSRNIDLSQDELSMIQSNVLTRHPVGEKVRFSQDIPEIHWKCFVRVRLDQLVIVNLAVLS